MCTHWKVGGQRGQFSLAPRSLGEKECGHLQAAKAQSPPPYWLQPRSQSQYTPGRYEDIINTQETEEEFPF